MCLCEVERDRRGESEIYRERVQEKDKTVCNKTNC